MVTGMNETDPACIPVALVNHPDIRPAPTGRCVEDECPSFDGKRCRAIGFRPGEWCEPWVLAMREELVQLRARQ